MTRGLANLLVAVFAMIVVLGVLLPVLGRIREAGGRMSCENRARIIGLTIANYGDSQRTFPKAALPNADLTRAERLSWLFAISPYVQAVAVWYPDNDKLGWNSEENRHRAMLPYVFDCPMFINREPPSVYSPSNYMGIAGLGSDAASLSADDPKRGVFNYAYALESKGSKGGNGTLLVFLETARVSGAWTATGYPTVRGVEEGSVPYIGIQGQFGGIHAEGASAGFADGSYRFIKSSIDPRTLKAMATVNGSQRLGAEALD